MNELFAENKGLFPPRADSTLRKGVREEPSTIMASLPRKVKRNVPRPRTESLLRRASAENGQQKKERKISAENKLFAEKNNKKNIILCALVQSQLNQFQLLYPGTRLGPYYCFWF